uniref:hypothetical protein n=1 Tax=Halomonas sp. TaxID=1486246 RepID=UPI002619A8E7|nr:hypothetical protein [Halomonas sp.]
MPTQSGGRYELRGGKRVLVERSGHKQANPKPTRPADLTPTKSEKRNAEHKNEDSAGRA